MNAERLRHHLEELSVFGRPAGGSFADGVSRVAYSDADVAGRRYVMGLMEAAGLKPRIDPAGNIFARRAGSEATLPPVLFGSHVDSVPSGGNFDGDLGSLSAIEVVQTLNEAGVTTRRPLEVVVWANEEGVAFNNGLDGSRAAAGHTGPGDLEQVWNGVKKADAIRKIGGDPARIAEARSSPAISTATRTAHRTGRYARARRHPHREWWKESWPSTATRPRSSASPIMPALPPCPSAATRCWPLRT